MSALKRLGQALRGGVEMLLLQRRAWREAGHVLTFVLMLVVVAWSGSCLNALDWRLAALLAARSTPWPADVEVVDLEWDLDPAGLETFRTHLAGALGALAHVSPPPRIVVADVAISTVPLGLEPLRRAAQDLKGSGVRLVVVANRDAYGIGVQYAEALRRQGAGPEVYAGIAKFAHTSIDGGEPNFWYSPCLPLQAGLEGEPLPAVPYFVSEHLRAPNQKVACPPPGAQPVVFQPGLPELLEQHRWRLQDGRLVPPVAEMRGESALSHAVVVVGNIRHDRVKGRAGPELIAWAIGDASAPSPPTAPRLVLLASWGWTLGFALAFSALAVGVFASLQRMVPLPHRHLLASTAGTLVGTLGLLALLLVLMRFGFYVLYLQVSYVVVMVVVALALAWHAMRERLRERAMYTDVLGPPELVDKVYDVFVSYSHTPEENDTWVKKNIVAELRKYEFDGRPLRVFFDYDGLPTGAWWYFDLAEKIESSHCMVAVYSDDYFRKNFCTFELGKAVVRDIAAHGQGFAIIPVMRGSVQVPPAFSHLQFMTEYSSEKLVNEVLDKLRSIRPPSA